MALGKDYVAQECSIARALEVIGERWTLLVVRDAFYGIRRYSDFLGHLGLPRAVLATRLQALERAGVLEKRRYQDSPPRDEYVLTDSGIALWPILRSLSVWGTAHVAGTKRLRVFTHADCGTELGSYGECPACSTAVPPQDVEMLPGEGLDPEPSDPVSRALLRPRRLLQPLEADRV
ncbi:winged helix-turn-helix transcriptional regulator [Streptomyces lushanensis]|uniref:winged helix-turn-helix transcriptional regulator n=1 Tax=Streptomyces lushanensis TaxID=1434255 RepID=UPI00082B2147|nr:helix-turn-helix domain-containing protein [Streptomyces lushanensis]